MGSFSHGDGPILLQSIKEISAVRIKFWSALHGWNIATISSTGKGQCTLLLETDGLGTYAFSWYWTGEENPESFISQASPSYIVDKFGYNRIAKKIPKQVENALYDIIYSLKAILNNRRIEK